MDTEARSANNAAKLGFYAKQAVLLTDEDQQAFKLSPSPSASNSIPPVR